MGKTNIEWASDSWNPVTGCTEISPGCAHCYARRMARRLGGRCGYPEYPNEFSVTLHPEKLSEPARWKKPREIFVCSMSDLFHKDVPDDYIAQVFEVMKQNPRHTFMVLTKRAKRMYEFINAHPEYQYLPNVIGMVTVENQDCANERIPYLTLSQFVTRGLSCEPLLGPIDLTKWLLPVDIHESHGILVLDSLLDWIVAGGETGMPASRPMHPLWAQLLRDQCVESGAKFFFKSWGMSLALSQATPEQQKLFTPTRTYKIDSVEGEITMALVGKPAAGRLLDGREWNEFPE